MRPLGLGFGHALHAMAAAFELQLAVGPFALDAQNDLLESAQLGRRHVEHFDLPALVLGVVLVHLVEVAGEQGGLLAAGAGANFQDAARAGWRPRRRWSCRAARSSSLSRSALSCGQFGLGQLAHVGVGPVDHLQGVADLGVEVLEAAVLRGQLGQRAVLARHGRQCAGLANTSGSTSCRSSSSKRPSFSSSGLDMTAYWAASAASGLAAAFLPRLRLV